MYEHNEYETKVILIYIFALLLNGVPALIRSNGASAQNFVLKTNLLYDATATINAGIEFKIAPKWTMDISSNFNAWMTPNDSDPATIDPKWKHWTIQPEAKILLLQSPQSPLYWYPRSYR